MSKPRTIVKDIVFKSSKTELCNWLHFIYLIQAKIRIYPYLGKPVNGYIAKSSYRSLSLPKGKSQLVFTKTKGSKNGKPIDFDNIKIIGFPTRMDNKVQQYIFDIAFSEIFCTDQANILQSSYDHGGATP